MVSVCYIIVCVNLLNPYCQAETLTNTYSLKKKKIERQNMYLNSLTIENQDENLASWVTPYRNMTYDLQLEKKQRRCAIMVNMIATRFESLKNATAPEILKVVPSPVTKAYRNRDEFKIWYGVDGNPKTVGCVIGKISLGRMICVRPTKILTIKESHKRVAQVYEDFVRLSPLRASYKLGDVGYWWSLTVRSNEADEVMATVIVRPDEYDIETRNEQTKFLKEYFLEHLPNITLYQQECSRPRCSSTTAPYNHLYGKTPLIEHLNGYKITVSPDTFLRTNTLGAAVFYKSIIRMARLKPNTTLLDMSCSTGVMGIMASKLVREFFGIDANSKTVKMANNILRLNNIHNGNVTLVKTENELNSLLQNLKGSRDIVPILHPGFAFKLGWHILKTILRSSQISRLLYVCATHKNYKTNVFKNFDYLFSNATSEFPPFRLTKAIPVDVYPQTDNFELILLFQRLPVGHI